MAKGVKAWIRPDVHDALMRLSKAALIDLLVSAKGGSAAESMSVEEWAEMANPILEKRGDALMRTGARRRK